MNELLQKHGCANVFTVPEGLKELMADITREVLREQPASIFDFITNYLSVLLMTRENGILAVRILEDLCDCRPSVSETLTELGFEREKVEDMSQIIKEEVEVFVPVEGKEKVRELQIMKKILARNQLDEVMSASVCQVIRNAYRDYWYRKNLLKKNLEVHPTEPWEVAAEHTLSLYKQTKPSITELNRATLKIQAAYKGYAVRRELMCELNKNRAGPKVDLQGPPIDVAGSREIDLGPVLDIKPNEEVVGPMFEERAAQELGLPYDPMRMVTHVDSSAKLETRPRTAQFGDAPKSNLTPKAVKSAPARFA